MKKQVVFACDIGGSKLLCGFVDEDGDIIDTEKALLPPNITTDNTTKSIFLYTFLITKFILLNFSLFLAI
jgi:predicted NBD/HSP70 family sugar kinase